MIIGNIYYTDPSGRRWRILEAGVPRSPGGGEHYIDECNGTIRCSGSSMNRFRTIVEAVAPKRYEATDEYRLPKKGEAFVTVANMDYLYSSQQIIKEIP